MMKINQVWNKKSYKMFLDYLISIGNDKTKEFNKKIIDTKYEMIGIKMGELRSLAKDISKTDIMTFFDESTDTYYEEVMIQGIVISYIKDPQEFEEYFNRFILKIDCWGLSDSCVASYKIMKKYDFSSKANLLIYSNSEYLQRVGYLIYLNYYIDDEHINDIYHLATIPSDYYYVNMAISWLLATCFTKYRPMILDLLKSKELSPFVQNKTISKIRESLVANNKDKELVNKYKIKN